MRIIRNHLLPPKNYDAINILGLLFCRRGTTLTANLLRHERIHTAQMLEMGIVGFYLWYVAEWLVRLPMKGRAYTNISLEREAYAHMGDENYLCHSPRYGWWKYLRAQG